MIFKASDYNEDFNATWDAAILEDNPIIFLTGGVTYNITPITTSLPPNIVITTDNRYNKPTLLLPNEADSGIKLINASSLILEHINIAGSDTSNACLYGVVLDGSAYVKINDCSFYGFGVCSLRNKKYDSGDLYVTRSNFYNMGSDRHGGSNLGHGIFPGRHSFISIDTCYFHNISPLQPDAKSHAIYLVDANDEEGTYCKVNNCRFDGVGGAVGSFKLVRGSDIDALFTGNKVINAPRGVVGTQIGNFIVEGNTFKLNASASGYGVNFTNVDYANVVNNTIVGENYSNTNGIVIYDAVSSAAISNNHLSSLRNAIFVTSVAENMSIYNNKAVSKTFLQVEGLGSLVRSEIRGNSGVNKGGNFIYFSGSENNIAAIETVVTNNRQLHNNENDIYPSGPLIKARYITGCYIDKNYYVYHEGYNLENIGNTHVGSKIKVESNISLAAAKFRDTIPGQLNYKAGGVDGYPVEKPFNNWSNTP